MVETTSLGTTGRTNLGKTNPTVRWNTNPREQKKTNREERLGNPSPLSPVCHTLLAFANTPVTTGTV